MENKKTIIGIIIVLILIITLIVVSYLYNNFNQTQLNLLTEEANAILETDILNDGINLEIKTQRNYAIVEKAVKEYLIKFENIYANMEEMNHQINPNDIFSAQNIVEDESFEIIDNIINDYREKGENFDTEYQELVEEENILNNIKDKNIKQRTDYYIDLYNTIMLSEGMKAKYQTIKNEIQSIKYELNYKLDKLEDIKEFLDENQRYWSIKEDKIQFSNINKMTEYYELLNKVQS